MEGLIPGVNPTLSVCRGSGGGVTIRPFVDNDLLPLCAIQAKCPQAAQWLERDYLQLAGSRGGMVLVAETDAHAPPQVVGFAAFHRVDDEAEVRNVAIDPAHQRRGIARALV